MSAHDENTSGWFEVTEMTVRTTTRGGIHTGRAVGSGDVGRRVLHSLGGHRVERAWTAEVAIPLLMIATALTGWWIAWPVLVVASWWWTPSSNRGWVTVVMDGSFGAQWAYSGAMNIAQLPNDFGSVAVVWVAVPAVLAGSGHLHRRRMGRKEWQPDI
jgi:hypothetical protein